MSAMLIENGLVLTDSSSKPQYCSLLIKDGRFVSLLPPGTEVADAQVMDATDMLIHPGLVNGHMHAHTTLTKGMADRWSLEILLAAGMGIYGAMSSEDLYASAAIGAIELVGKGCTTVYDMCLQAPLPSPEGIGAVAKAYSDIGMRAVIAPMVSDINFFDATPGLLEAMPKEIQQALSLRRPLPFERSLAAMSTILKEWSYPSDKIKLALAPTIPLHCSDDFLIACKKQADDFGVGMQCHLQESKVQALAGLTRYGKTLTAHIDDLGLLGPNFVASHGVWLDDDDMARLGRAGASVCHNPGSNTILGSGLADMRGMLNHGVNVAIGTDGANCSDNLNMYESMRMAARVSHVRTPEISEWISAQEIFYAATEGGARAAGMSDIGRIAVGFKADLVMIDLSHINWIPTNDVLVLLVQSEDGNAVHSVMIDGKWVVRNREVVNMQPKSLRNHSQETIARLLALAVENGNSDLYKRLAPIVTCFCPALMHQPYRVERFGSVFTKTK